MHLEELFQYIEEKRREFIAKYEANGCFAGSTAGVFSQAENNAGDSSNEEAEAALTQAKVVSGAYKA